MEADLAQPPPPPAASPSSSGLERVSSSRPSSRHAASERGQLDPKLTKWEEWDRYATSMDCDWVVERDMQVFRDALSDEPSNNNNASNDAADQQQPEKIIAASDWAPVKEQRRRRGGGGSSSKPKKRKDVVREGWAYHISRWPLLGLIFLIIFLEFVAYLIVRQSVNTIEFFAGWRGERGRLRHKLRNAQTYEEWKRIALELDALLGLNQWKQSAPNAYYDAPLVRRVLKALREFRSRDDVEGVCAVLHACVRNNFAGVESFRLYSESYYGTKNLVQEYLDEVSSSLEYVRNAPPSALPLEEKADFFRSISKNLGASALCLSGGASFGYYHFGVVRALLDQNLLPRVITGTSAGAIVGAICCTRTDAELRELLKPSLADRITACSEPFTVWAKRAWRTGARFDTVEWARKASFFTMGSMTFKEAYERTGRIFNVSVIPYDTHSPTKLLNYITAPDIVIYTAVIASAAVPWIINPVVLLRKNKDGTLSAAEFQGRHKDGSLRVDIPLHALHLLYNVNFSIVSQVNLSHRKGRGWRGGFWLSAAEQYWKIEMLKWFRVIRDLELLPEFGGQNWSTVFLQKFEGSVTIWPKSRLKDWTRLLTDPDRDELARMIRVGQGVTWPKIKMIENRLKIERQIDLGRNQVRRLMGSGTAAPSTPALESAAALQAPGPLASSRRSSSDTLFRLPSERTSTVQEEEDEEEDPRASSAQPEEPSTPAQRRQAIWDRLGLQEVESRGSSDAQLGGAGAGRVGSGEGERWTDGGESDWTSGGEGGGSVSGMTSRNGTGLDGARVLRRRLRRASMSDFGGMRARRDTLSSDDEPR
ncbi:hypothetical protein C6P46_004849 [Rhodotorula mucilaginosa]|uniref:Patatin-like phospholipase domain-containing protein n=1 Tax=Rhodotorula mucilaginosa TaxID=5537 RepID=A0A9P6W012_RHOMI|nr:hypothetical protein C6P46_004849 [Rhodotorula mucilaginosa]